MCGRFALTTPEQLSAHFKLGEEIDLEPRYNIAPTQNIPVVVEVLKRPGRELLTMRWGLIPHWAENAKIGYKMINARAETVAEKPTFRRLFAKRRCLVPVNGFYEWCQKTTVKQPYFVGLKGTGLFALAGLWDRWQNPQGEFVQSCTIITTEANAVVGKIHDRMPLIIGLDAYSPWLNTDTDIEIVKKLMKPYESSTMTAYPVSGMVNSPKNEGPDCIKRLDRG